MNITEITISRTRVAIAIFIMILVAGTLQFLSLSRDSMPAFTVRIATVVTEFPGASPERVELLVSKPLEEKIQEVPEIKSLYSQSRTGVSVITIELKDSVKPIELQDVWDKIRRKVQSLDTLPQGVRIQVNDDSIGEVFGIMLGLSSDGLTPKELEDVAKDMRDKLITMENTAKVEIQGVQEQRIYVDYDNATIARYGISPAQLQQIIGTTNILYSGGEVNMGQERIVLEPTGNFNSIDELKQLIIPLQNNRTVYLGEIANVYKSYINPPKNKVRAAGDNAISIGISLKENANIVHLGKAVDSFVADYQKTLPLGTKIKRITSLDKYVDNSVKDFTSNLMQSIAIVLLVMLIFLGLRTGLIIASLIPTVILATLMFMGVIRMGLNQVTLAGLIMAMGMMVDNAVVVSELIMVKLAEGKDRYTAAKQACSELALPLLSSTLTTSLAFLSFYLADSSMGDIVGPLFVVISIALLSSWFLSLTLIALLCYLFIKVDTEGKPKLFDRFVNWIKEFYKVFINIALRFKYVFLGLIMLVFVGSLSMFRFVPFEFFPESDRNLITVDINLAPGTRIEETEKVVRKIESFIKAELLVADDTSNDTDNKNTAQGVTNYASYIGEGPASYDLGYSADEANPRYAHMLVVTSTDKENARVIQRIDEFALQNFPSADIKVRRLGSGPPGQPIEIFVYGDDLNKLEGIAEKIKAKLKHTKGTKNVSDDWGVRIKKLEVVINQERAQQLGLNNQQIAQTLESNLNGAETGMFREGDNSIPILMRNHHADSLNVDSLSEINVVSQTTGQSVPLLEVAKIQPTWQYSTRRRKNLSSVITVSSQLQEGENAAGVTKRFDAWLKDYANTWPAGFHFEYGGEDKNAQENFGAVLKYLPFCGFLIFMLLVIQFNSFRKMAIILSTIPLGLIGVVWGLILLRSSFGFMAFLGMISLAGIVINNAIVLVDRIELELQRGLAQLEAVKEACLQRFRPILLTSFTTVYGLIPLYVSGGAMWEPMAAVLMVGLLVGTMISLLFVPVLYCILYRVRDDKNGKGGKPKKQQTTQKSTVEQLDEFLQSQS